jgi:hypothetical protein
LFASESVSGQLAKKYDSKLKSKTKKAEKKNSQQKSKERDGKSCIVSVSDVDKKEFAPNSCVVSRFAVVVQ